MNDLIVFNKPYGVICQFSAHEKHASLKYYIDASGFYPAGRLDTDSEGLLLLTNNGRLQAQIAEPKFGKEKTYWAQLEGSPDEAKLNLLRQKMDLGDFIARPPCPRARARCRRNRCLMAAPTTHTRAQKRARFLARNHTWRGQKPPSAPHDGQSRLSLPALGARGHRPSEFI